MRPLKEGAGHVIDHFLRGVELAGCCGHPMLGASQHTRTRRFNEPQHRRRRRDQDIPLRLVVRRKSIPCSCDKDRHHMLTVLVSAVFRCTGCIFIVIPVFPGKGDIHPRGDHE